MIKKSVAFIALLMCAIVQVNGTSPDKAQFFVEGKVYCDPCHIQKESKLSRPLSDLKVRLECKKTKDGTVSYTIEGKTDKDGLYKLPVDGDHEADHCEVQTLSFHPDCSEFMHKKDSIKVLLTRNTGDSSMTRFINSLGFMTKTVDPDQCAEMIKEMESHFELGLPKEVDNVLF